MVFLSHNLKVLRQVQRVSQEHLARKMHISRAALAKYEGGVNQPPLEVIVRLSRYYKVTIDTLLTVKLTSRLVAQIGGKSLDVGMILPIQVDRHGENMIEVVAHSAQAGYAGNYSDPGFIESLDRMALPFREMYGKCRAFPISGDSMPPHEDGSFVVGRMIDSRADLREGKRYIVVSRDEGIVFKRVYQVKGDPTMLSLHSDNPEYDPFEMPWHEIVEIWEFVAAISFNPSDPQVVSKAFVDQVKVLQEEINRLAEQLRPAG